MPDHWNWKGNTLIEFIFEDQMQDISRFGDSDKHRFNWTRFYEAVADQLLTFRDRRDELISGIHDIASTVDGLSNLQDQFANGTNAPLNDICPFTAMGIFNRAITDENRKSIASKFASLLGVSEAVPDSFEGISIHSNRKSWFFGFHKDRNPDDIDTLWKVFAQAITFVESDDVEARSAFISAYDNATYIYNVGWNLTIGLYLMRPWNFPTLDRKVRSYMSKKLDLQIGKNSPKGYYCNANDYLEVLDTLEARFQEDAYPVHSFPELSLTARHFEDSEVPVQPNDTDTDVQHEETDATPDAEVMAIPIAPYSVNKILDDGCFIARSKLEKILQRLQTKKNLILQGPPGTGKTWLAKRLAFALMRQRDDSKVRPVQFHPNLSYEDFIRGWRPVGDGKLTLVDGPFMEMITAAKEDIRSEYVIVIEEINRGNPAQIFGEMLTLLEVDKRVPNEALELSYNRSDGERVFIPDNLYVIGTMNIADRSLALVDLALRRRFAFIDLEPTFGERWRDWVQRECGIDSGILVEIESRLIALNGVIADDASLGPQFRVGHSYVTPPSGTSINDAREWFRQVVDTEIGPLLDEYWFDDLDKSQTARRRLLDGI